MNQRLEKKLSKLPRTPGVYFHKDKSGEVIYIGKAAVLRNRVRQYFQNSRVRDPKTDALVAEIADVDWTEVETEADALFLEAELVRRYQPRYNILLRDDKSQQYVRIDIKSDYPTVTLVRRPLDDGANYYGPYINGYAVKKALRYLRRAFPYATARPVNQKRASLHYHLGLDPGLEDGRTSLEDYRANLRKLIQYIKGRRQTLIKEIEREMKQAAAAQDFERAAALRNQLFALRQLGRQTLFGDKEVQDASKDRALVELAELLGLTEPPKRIEGYDISHMQGTDTVASMVVFASGIPDKAGYRKFKMRLPGNDDFAHMKEVITRRFREENRKKWSLPGLVLIDGGKGQLSAALEARDAREMQSIPFIGLAKKDEEIIIARQVDNGEATAARAEKLGGYIKEDKNFITVRLPRTSHVVKLLQRIRDESHRFAVSYHSTLKRGRQTGSLLDEIPGIGPLTKRRLIRRFGSVRGVLWAEEAEIAGLLGPRRGRQLHQYLAAYRK